MIHGSCLCGHIAFRLDEAEILMMNNCHCTRCRKASAAAFATFVHVSSRDFAWIRGAGDALGYESSPGMVRAFCGRCGSSVPWRNEEMDQMVVPAGLLDGDPRAHPEADIFTADKVPWLTLAADAVSFPAEESEAFWQAYLARSRNRATRA